MRKFYGFLAGGAAAAALSAFGVMSAGALLASAAGSANAEQLSSGQRASEAGVYHVAKTGHVTLTNECNDARCQPLVVYLPLGAQVDQVECWSNINWGKAADLPHGQLKQAVCGMDGAWAIFDSVVIETTPTNVVVRSVFRNRSSDWDRDVKLVVRYTIA